MVDSKPTINYAMRTNRLYHYTSPDVAVFNILADGKIRLSPLASTNDPRESRMKYSGFSTNTGDVTDQEREEFIQVVDLTLRRHVKLACFTLDYAFPHNSIYEHAFRGYVHVAQWAHYAAGHSGICLGFDRKKLIASLEDQLGPFGSVLTGEIKYEATELTMSPTDVINMDQVKEFGVDVVARRYSERNAEKLFFTKDADWKNEEEFRLILLDSLTQPRHISIRDSLTHVVLGDAFPESRLESLHEIMREWPGVPVEKVNFFNGRLHVIPVRKVDPERNLHHRREGSFTERLSAFSAAEKAAVQAKADGETRFAPWKNTLENILQPWINPGRWTNAEVELTPRRDAIPSEKLGAPAGVPGRQVSYSTGNTLIVENLPKYSTTLVVAVAAQILSTDKLEVFGTAWMEEWQKGKDGANRRTELWQFVHTIPFNESSTTQAISSLSANLGENIALIRTKFDETRSGG